jgi:excisionase family DNA binding protein
MDRNLLSTTEVAKLLGVTRITIFKKIKSGEIKAQKIGRNFVIRKEDLPNVLSQVLQQDNKKDIEESVRKTIKEYGQALKLLGKE